MVSIEKENLVLVLQTEALDFIWAKGIVGKDQNLRR